MRLVRSFVFCAALALPLLPAEQAAPLPIKRVVLYKNGVGYFEHVGQIRQNQDVTLTFTSGQLDDVLKSLTILDLGGGRITNVMYGSSAPMDRKLADLGLSSGERPTLNEFLGALRGARLEIRSATAVTTGRLLSIDRKTRISGGTTLEIDYLSLLTDAGEVRTVELSPGFAVRLLDPGLSTKANHFLDLVSSAREPEARRVVISASGSGERPLFVSYLSEVPIWKATYRIVLPSQPDRKPLLQGWAIVDNTVGQDWKEVQLSLVAGAPQSFIQKLSQPYYSRRPVVPLPGSVNLAPQTYESAIVSGGGLLVGTIKDASDATVPDATVRVYEANRLLGETRSTAAGSYEFHSLPDGELRLEVEFLGFNKAVIRGIHLHGNSIVRQDVQLAVASTVESVEVTAAGTTAETSASSRAGSRSTGSGRQLGGGGGGGGGGGRYSRRDAGSGGGIGAGAEAVEAARARTEIAAFAQETGDLFEYNLKEPITIRKDQSALVPIVNAPVSVEKVSIWNERIGSPHPQRALWLKNSSGLTLDGGTFSVIEDEMFAGEGLLDPIRPDERRLISYASDPAVTATAQQIVEPQPVVRVRVSHGSMTHASELREKKTYTLRNEAESARVVILEHQVRAGYELRSDARPVETSAGWMRFRLEIGSKQTASLVVVEARPVQATYLLTNLTAEQLATFVRQRAVDAQVEAALGKILAQKEKVSDIEDKKDECEKNKDLIFDDQQRLRENMKVLKGSAEERALIQRYTQRLNEQESRLDTLRQEIERLERQQDSAQAELDRMIDGMAFDMKL